MPLRDFYTGDGINYRRLQPNELVTRVFLPAQSAGYRGVYRKLRVRGSIDYPLAGVAVAMKRVSNGDGVGHVSDVHIAITAVNPAPMLVKGVNELLAGKTIDEASGRCCRRHGGAHGKAVDDLGVDAGVSARDDSSVYQKSGAGSIERKYSDVSPYLASICAIDDVTRTCGSSRGSRRVRNDRFAKSVDRVQC